MYASLVAEDAAHARARRALLRLKAEGAVLVTTSYVVHECLSLLQARHGIGVLMPFQQLVYPNLDIVWVERALHERAMTGLLAAARSRSSVTDWVSFEVMRDRGMTRALAFDEDFTAQGFELIA